ncbi:diguanylate cyclase domain-containing protein [Bacillus marasmi]|uniref:diguanylate cyclase domain-containing protein n=1 Tax=Bacillus marasmi TaxID=1926279 RepID=UPI0011CA9A8A|nr:diguanylate cyclase [Bacillus marasmi]
MDDDSLIKYRNSLMVKGVWIFIILDIPLNMIFEDIETGLLIASFTIPPMLLLTFLIKKGFGPKLTMYFLSILSITVLFILNTIEEHYINLFFLLIPPMLSVAYRNWQNIIFTTLCSAGAFTYFMIFNGQGFFVQWKETDIYYFLLFFFSYSLLKIYESRFTEGVRGQLINELNRVKLLQNKLHDSEIRYRSMLKQSTEGIYAFNPFNKTIVETNERFCEMLGYKEEELLKLTLEDIIISDMATVEGNIETVLKKNQHFVGEKVYRRKDGSSIIVEVRGSLIHFNNESAILANIRDITDRREMEEKQKRNAARLEAIISHMPYGIVAEDKENKITLINEQFSNVFKLSVLPTDVLGMKHVDLFNLGKDQFLEGDLIENRIKEIFASREKVIGEEWRLKNGDLISRDAILIFTNGEFEGYLWQFKDITEQRKLELELKEASIVDGLTNILNRRFFDEAINNEWGRCSRVSKSLTLIMLDIDCFKAYNDTYGHQSGDECLIKVAQTIKDCIRRPSDIVCRYGGEEFAIILPETNQQGGLIIAEKIRLAIEGLEIPHISSIVSNVVTCSLGVATVIPSRFLTPMDIIRMSDNALYTSKNAGRNQVNLYKREPSLKR